jgi:hypothetical protein
MSNMGVVALGAWLLTGGCGLYLLAIWLIEYDREFQSVAATRLPVPVISTHALLAVTGMVLWTVFLMTGVHDLDWLVAAILGVVATLGGVMAVRWIGVYRAYGTRSRHAHAAVPVPVGAGYGGTGAAPSHRAAIPPERHFPVSVVILHGVFAVATFVLVLLAALAH